jgi:hypothetical protein
MFSALRQSDPTVLDLVHAEAKKHGLVNHIKLPKIEVTFDVQMTFG